MSMEEGASADFSAIFDTQTRRLRGIGLPIADRRDGRSLSASHPDLHKISILQVFLISIFIQNGSSSGFHAGGPTLCSARRPESNVDSTDSTTDLRS
jgi:hypothetical protein